MGGVGALLSAAAASRELTLAAAANKKSGVRTALRRGRDGAAVPVATKVERLQQRLAEQLLGPATWIGASAAAQLQVVALALKSAALFTATGSVRRLVVAAATFLTTEGTRSDAAAHLSSAERDAVRRGWLSVALAIVLRRVERGDVALILQLVVARKNGAFAAELLAMLISAFRAEKLPIGVAKGLVESRSVAHFFCLHNLLFVLIYSLFAHRAHLYLLQRRGERRSRRGRCALGADERRRA